MVRRKNKQLHIGLFGLTGAENWRSETANLYNWNDPALLIDIARLAERAKLDMITFADAPALPKVYHRSYEQALKMGDSVMIDPIVALSMISGATKHIGLACTATTTFTPPYHIARQMASLDHISGGRAAWNVVTGAMEEAAANYGMTLPEHDLRYDMADEHLAACRALWRSWDADAVVRDRASGTFADYTKVREANFKGKYYSTQGPLNCPSPPQIEPLIIMAGSSSRGRRFAAENAEVIIVNMNTVEDIKKFSKEIRDELERVGRDPYSCKIFWSTKPWIADTEQEAIDKMERHKAKLDYRDGLSILSMNLGHDLAHYDLDKPLPDNLEVNAIRGMLLRYTGANPDMTLREIGLREAGHETFPFCGTPEQVADMIQYAAEEADVDGVNFRYVCKDFLYVADIATKVVPILQKRGLFRTEYSGKTLRENLFETNKPQYLTA